MADVAENWHQSRASFRRSQSHERDRPIPESVVEIDSRSASKQACKKWTLTRIEYFIPVILRSFPVIGKFPPCYCFGRFRREMPMDVGLSRFSSLIYANILVFPCIFPSSRDFAFRAPFLSHSAHPHQV